MTPNPPPPRPLEETFGSVEAVYRLTRLMIDVTVRALRHDTRCHFEHRRAWDHVSRPGRHFLEGRHGCVDRVWVSFLPEGPVGRGVLFHLHFVDRAGLVAPAVAVGSLDPGPGGFGAVGRRAPVRATARAERPDEGVARDGPLTVVRSSAPGDLREVVLLRLPLAHLASYRQLRRRVVAPLVALLRGDRERAKALLAGVTTLPWAGGPATCVALGAGERDGAGRVSARGGGPPRAPRP